MPDSAPIVTQLTLALPNFVNNFYIEFNESQANCIVADKWSWTDMVLKKRRSFCYFLTNVTKLRCCCQRSLLWRKLNLRYSMVICSLGISLRILFWHNLVTRVLLSTVSAEILAAMRNVL